MFRKILLVLFALFIIIQFVRPAKNRSADSTRSMASLYPVPADVRKILETSCADCHSNKTVYPWYAEVQPVGWWLNNHVKEGKRHFNLDDFTGRRIGWQFKKMDDCIEQLNNDEMPLETYTMIHHNARLSPADKQTLISWCESVKTQIKLKYPADSLVMPKRNGRQAGH
jgi:Haem-binding domain